SLALFSGCQLQTPLTLPLTLPMTAARSMPELKLRLNLSQPKRFQIQSPSQPEDVVSIRFCLIEHTTGTSPAGPEDIEPVSQVFSYSLEPDSTLELNFGRVRANAAGKSYSVAVAALDLDDLNITNSTDADTDPHRVQISGEAGYFYLSSGGGDPDFPGSVRVSPVSYALSGTLSLSVDLKLADG
ncbi:MAG: hypothetical protein ACAI44_13945, partial [Candidatus Sericytochromatia bacterium]